MKSNNNSLYYYFVFASFGALKCVDGWWRHTTLYEINLPTYKDSNGDGIGDIRGLISKLDYLSEIGIDSVYITPHYESPLYDGGYDISNFTSVRPSLGTLADLEELSSQAKDKGLKLIIDLVLNHSSDQHPWFIKSVNNEYPYSDYYVWKNPKGYDEKRNPIPPNNWVSFFGTSIWTWNIRRKQFYLHHFFEQQPDLNLRNEAVREEIKKILKFWLDRGVAGFRLDAPRCYIEDEQFRDNPLISPAVSKSPKFHEMEHIYSLDLPDTYEFIHEIRKFIDDYSDHDRFNVFERILAPEVYASQETTLRYFDREGYKVTQLPLNFFLVPINQYENATFYNDLITNCLNNLPEGATPSWNVENHDNMRKAQVFGEEYEKLMVTWVMMLPGVAYLYYGQEIGMTGARVRKDQEIDNLSHFFPRDHARLPMQWDNSINAGFTTKLYPLLPVSPNYWRINVKTMKAEKYSRYFFFKSLSDLRKTDTLKYGLFKSYVLSTWVWAFTRTLVGHEIYLVLSNLGSETEVLNLPATIEGLPDIMKVEVAASNSGFMPGDTIQVSVPLPEVFALPPLSVVVLSSKIDSSQLKNNMDVEKLKNFLKLFKYS